MANLKFSSLDLTILLNTNKHMFLFGQIQSCSLVAAWALLQLAGRLLTNNTFDPKIYAMIVIYNSRVKRK